MAYNELLANRVREIIARTHHDVEEKKMFGGLCFMVNGKMCVGVETARLMLRVGPVKYGDLLQKEGSNCYPMDFTGKPMKGYVYVNDDVVEKQPTLEFWIAEALEYNKEAKSSKKKK